MTREADEERHRTIASRGWIGREQQLQRRNVVGMNIPHWIDMLHFDPKRSILVGWCHEYS
jgi:hypothetical protein